MDLSQTAVPKNRARTSGHGVEDLLGQGIAAVTGAAGRYNRVIDALNRLPRPVLMVLTIGLFAYATLDPAGFAARMQSLERVPEPLWWMQGAVVTFYFGARESHYLRQGRSGKAEDPKEPVQREKP